MADAKLARLAWLEWGVTLDEYWSEAPNVLWESGITYPRLAVLTDLHEEEERFATFRIGQAVNAAMAEDPKKWLNGILNPVKTLTYEDVPPMLRAAKSLKQLALEEKN